MVEPVILVVDDEPLIRVLAKRFLERSGYKAMEAGSGAEALRVLRQQPCNIALLLTDIVMPGISGIELAQEAHALQPALPVIFLSGYSSRLADSVDSYPCLQKPFKRQELVRLVAKALAVKTKAAH